jgi:hypothetical protein
MNRADGEAGYFHHQDDDMSTPDVEAMLSALACVTSWSSLLPPARRSTGEQFDDVYIAHKALHGHNEACLCSGDCQRG